MCAWSIAEALGSYSCISVLIEASSTFTLQSEEECRLTQNTESRRGNKKTHAASARNMKRSKENNNKRTAIKETREEI